MFTLVHINWPTQARTLSGGESGSCKVCISLIPPDNAGLCPQVNASSVPALP